MPSTKPAISAWLLAGLFLIWLGVVALGVSLYRDGQDAPLDSPDDSVYQASVPTSTITPAPTLTAAPTATPVPPSGPTQAPSQNAVSTSESATATVTPIPLPSPTSTPAQIWNPDRIIIPAIKLDDPVVNAGLRTVKVGDSFYRQWSAPDLEAAGWLTTSASLGLGNTVFVGHNNGTSHVFAHLQDLKPGDVIELSSSGQAFYYSVMLTMRLPEKGQPMEVRLKNASWLEPTPDNRLTLVTCWPFFANTHRLIIVAEPISEATFNQSTVTPRRTPLPILGDWSP
jgi:sortase A